MNYVEMLHEAFRMDEANSKDSILLRDAKISAFLMDNCEFEFSPDNIYFVKTNVGKHGERVKSKITKSRVLNLKPEIVSHQDRMAADACTYDAWQDFGHTNPGWDNIFRLGLGGLKERILNRKGPALNPDFAEAERLVLKLPNGSATASPTPQKPLAGIRWPVVCATSPPILPAICTKPIS